MNILAPDEDNFNHLEQVDINISPYISNMKKVLTNSRELLISDSFDRAIEIHSQLPHLDFPFSQWSKFKTLEKDKVLKVMENIPIANYEKLIDDCVNVFPIKPFKEKDNIYPPFIISTLLSEQSKKIITNKGYNYQLFQHDMIQDFVDKISSYKKETALFAFIEITLFYQDILPENETIFTQLSDDTIHQFLSNVFKNDYCYYIKNDMNNNIFSNKCRNFFGYLKTSHQNKIFDYFLSKICVLDNIEQNIYPTLFPEEIKKLQNLKKEHDFLVLDNKFSSKPKGKKSKI